MDGKEVVYGLENAYGYGITGHGIVYLGQPVMNANDHEVGIHIIHFGDCNSKKIFEEAKKEADEKYKAEEGDDLNSELVKRKEEIHGKK